MKKLILMSIFMLAIVANSFALKIYAYLVDVPNPGCFELYVIITETGPDGDEYVVGQGPAFVGECNGYDGGSGDLISVPASSPLERLIQNPEVQLYLQQWYSQNK